MSTETSTTTSSSEETTSPEGEETTGPDTSTDSDDLNAPTEETSVLDLKVGDCFTAAAEATSVESVPLIDCNAPHLYEVYQVEDLTTDSLPSSTEIESLAGEICTPAFETYVGISYDSSMYYTSYLYPTATSWAMGDRAITCVLTSGDGSELTGSAAGTAQ